MQRGLWFSIIVACLLSAGRLSAQAVRYVAQERRVESSVDEQYFSTEEGTVNVSDADRVDATDFGLFDARAVAAKRTDNGGYSVATTTDATFDVVGGPVAFDLTYGLQGPGVQQNGHHVDLLLRRVDGAGGDVFRVAPAFDIDTYLASGTESGVLEPGRYEFRYFDSIWNDVGDRGDNRVSLQFTPVPEPGAMGLLLGGLAVLVGRRGWRRT